MMSEITGSDEKDHDDASTASGQEPAPEARTALRRFRAGAATAAEPLVDGVTNAIGAAMAGLRELPGVRVRRVRRLGRRVLPSLDERYPQARRARPVEVGMLTVPVDQIRGTAVGGGDQRGGDFLPLRPFRGRNWAGRWQRLRRAHEALANLPAIDVVKYGDGYWVIDGHNRVALALYTGQQDIDASVVELVPPGGHRSEPIGTLAGVVEAARPVRSRATTETSEAARTKPAKKPTTDARPDDVEPR
jgi:hypothetical protein